VRAVGANRERLPSEGSSTSSSGTAVHSSRGPRENRAAVYRFVLAARLRPDGRQRAETLLAQHSALGAEELETAFDRHAIFLSETEAIFLFEGTGANEAVRAVFNDPVRSTLMSHWSPLFDGPLHRVPEAYLWEREADG
jgi:hypothetical protein